MSLGKMSSSSSMSRFDISELLDKLPSKRIGYPRRTVTNVTDCIEKCGTTHKSFKSVVLKDKAQQQDKKIDQYIQAVYTKTKRVKDDDIVNASVVRKIHIRDDELVFRDGSRTPIRSASAANRVLPSIGGGGSVSGCSLSLVGGPSVTSVSVLSQKSFYPNDNLSSDTNKWIKAHRIEKYSYPNACNFY